MKLEFENLGALSVGKLNVADLTIICGGNNTGKTYLTYTLYGLLKTWRQYVAFPRFDLPTLRESGVIEINLQSRIIHNAASILQRAMEAYCLKLHQVLAAEEKRFADTLLHLELNLEGILSPEYQRDFTSGRNRRIVSFEKLADSPVLSINSAVQVGDPPVNFPYQQVITGVIQDICFAPVLPPPFIVSTERTGAVMFQGELNLTKNRLIDIAGEVSGPGDINPIKLFERVASSYPLPVRDNIDFLNTLATMQAQESELLKTFPDILNDFEALIGGAYKLQNNALQFVPKDVRGLRLHMGESSSAVRSLVILGSYLRYRAKPGDLLMIDEPELNLHPANQRRIARLLARLVNAGIKVFVTTHSDYIIKEFNTLIMLNNPDSRLEAVRERWNYAPQDRLDPNRVRVYMLQEEMTLKEGNTRRRKRRTLCEAPISPTLGIEVASFDNTIEEMNAIQEAIYYGLNDGGTNEA